MSTDRRMPSIPPMSPEMSSSFRENQESCKKHGRDFETEVDTWARRMKDDFEKLGLSYPENGTLEEKWMALREATIERRLETLPSDIRTYIGRLQEPNWPQPKKYLDPEKLEQEMNEEESKYPQLKPLIEKVREAIRELKQVNHGFRACL